MNGIDHDDELEEGKEHVKKWRMILWLFLGIVFYGVSLWVGPSYPLIQTTLYKLGHVTILAFFGYWISRQALGRIYTKTQSDRLLARAVLIGAVIIAGSLGL